MNVYDCAHNLATAVKESEEYKDFKRQEEKVNANPDLSKMIKDFQQKSIDFQLKQMSGDAVDSDFQNSLQQLYGIVMQDPQAANYLQASMRFSIMMKDVYEILGEVTGTDGLL